MALRSRGLSARLTVLSPASDESVGNARLESRRPRPQRGDGGRVSDQQGRRERPSERGGVPAQRREHLARGRETIRKVLDAGMEVFGRDGYHGASVGDIVERAGISRGTFYLYFSNKDDLFRALALDVTEEMSTLVESLRPLAPNQAGAQELRRWLEQYLMLCTRLAPVVQAWAEAFAAKAEFGALGSETLGGFTAAIEHRIAAMGVPDPQITALALVGMLDRFSMYVQFQRVDSSRDEMLDALTRVVLGMLFGPELDPPAVQGGCPSTTVLSY